MSTQCVRRVAWVSLVVVVIGNPLTAVSVDDLVSLQIGRFDEAGLITD